MEAKYKAGFLIPKGARKRLGEDGWEFESNERLPNELESRLAKELTMSASGKEFSSFEGNSIKVEVSKDSNGHIETVYFRFYIEPPRLPRFLENIENKNAMEFFVPSSDDYSK